MITPVRWIELGEQQIHLIPVDEPDVISPRHFAIHVDDIQAVRATMTERGVEVRETVPIAGADRFFIADPDGNYIEMILTVSAATSRIAGVGVMSVVPRCT